MNYEKQTFVDGDILTAEQLNHMERGIAKMAAIVSNPNLLDNWYFCDPINQRDGYLIPPGAPYYVYAGDQVGITDKYYKVDKITENLAWITINNTQYVADQSLKVRGYSGAGTYCVDRWKIWGDGVNVYPENGGLILSNTGATNGIFQYFECFPLSGFMTISCLFDDGEMWYETGELNAGVIDINNYIVGAGGVYLYADGTDSHFSIRLDAGNTKKIVAAKLELGSEQTLARKENGVWVLNDPPPNKALELAKCQRYYQETEWITGVAVATSADRIDTICVPFVAEMRTTPSVEINSAVLQNVYVDKASLIGTGVSVTVLQPYALNTKMIGVNLSGSFATNVLYRVIVPDRLFKLSADL